MFKKQTKIEREQRLVSQMIAFYCHRKHGHKALCADCSELTSYAVQRLGLCRFGEAKPTCRKCPVHCYKPEMKQRMQCVMRWSGPRIFFLHPVDTLLHLWSERRGL